MIRDFCWACVRNRLLMIAVPATVAAALAARAVWLAREVQEVPGTLAWEVRQLGKSGWTVYARHPLRCQEPAPHVHLHSPGGYLDMTLLDDGKVRLR